MMSSTQNSGRKAKAQNSGNTHSKDWPKAADSFNPKAQPTAEQMRIAQIINDANKSDDPDLQKKIEQVMELTGKCSDTAIIALHDCDNDSERAVNMLLEGTQNEGEWELTGKKKKNRQAQKINETTTEPGGNRGGSGSGHSNKENRGGGGGESRGERRGGPRHQDGGKGRDDFRSRGPPRLSRGGGRNWRNKESEKNERNLEESRRNTDGRENSYDSRPRGGRRGRGGRGSGEGGRREGGRGGEGSRTSRTFQNRGLSSSGAQDSFPQSIDTWTNSTAEQASETSTRNNGGNWGEFNAGEDWSEEDWTEGLTETKVFTPSTSVQSTVPEENTTTPLSQSLDLVSLLHKQSSDATANGLPSQQAGAVGQPPTGSSPGQNQFSLSQYAQQAAESIKAAVGITSGMSNVSSASAVSSQAYSSFPSAPPGVPPSSLVQSTVDLQGTSLHQQLHQQATLMKQQQQQNVLPSRAKSQRPRIPPPSKIPESAVEMPDDAITALDVQFGGLEFGTDSSFNFSGLSESGFQDSVGSNHLNSAASVHSGSVSSTSSVTNQANSLKDSYGLSAASHLTTKDLSQSSGLNSQKGSDSMMLSSQNDRSKVSGPNYGGQRSSTQSAVEGPYSGGKSSLLGSSSSMSSSSGGGANYGNSSLVDISANNQSQSSYLVGGPTNHGSVNSAYAMQTAYNTTPSTTSYVAPTGYTSLYTYPTQPTGYSNSTLSNNSSSKLSSNSMAGHDATQNNAAQLTYDNGGTVLGSTMVSNNATLGTSSSTNTTSVLKNSLSASKSQPNIPPGVAAAPIMGHHQYIMSQAGTLPFYGLQQPLYTSIEEMQMVHSRMPQMGYYDMQFSAPTSLTGRDPNMGSIAYTGADVKFSRTDSDASSVATTLSQGQTATQSHGQTFLNPAIHPGYGYYFPSGVMPGSIPHYAAPPIFPVPPATNAHGASTNTQYQKANAYGSHSYGSGTGTTADLSNSIYTKSHQQLAKAAGPIGNSSTAYPATPFIPVLTQHSTMLHHHMNDSPQTGAGAQGGGARSAPQSMGPSKGPANNKQSYPYWNTN